MARSHLNGSLNLPTRREVFSEVGDTLRDEVSRVPDGETERLMWVNSLVPMLREIPQIEQIDARYLPDVAKDFEVFTLRPGFAPDDVDFSAVDLAANALRGYADFRRARDEGVLAPRTRFQVCSPTPTALVQTFFTPDLVEGLLPRYTRHLGREIDQLARSMPDEDLAFQWDVAPEMAAVTGGVEGIAAMTQEAFISRLVTLATLVPDSAELGFHLCYGDPRPDTEPPGRQVVVPKDTGMVVALMNALSAACPRSVQWFSIPVPASQATDVDYFEPLRRLELHPETELQLGLVDDADGLVGSQRRADLAKTWLSHFGVATVCGMGRRNTSAIRDLLEIHRDLRV